VVWIRTKKLIQIAERQLADAEEAYRIDPSDANQRRIMNAWSAVRRARDVREDRQTKKLRAGPAAASRLGNRGAHVRRVQNALMIVAKPLRRALVVVIVAIGKGLGAIGW
jgi:hypothetical protein